MKSIPNFPGYFATKDGRIWSEPKGHKYTVGRFLRPSLNAGGYFRINLCKNKKRYRCLIHRLILETFVGPCPDGMACCHNNGIRTDNQLENLRWDTYSNNQLDSVKHGTSSGLLYGENSGNVKLTEQKVRMIIYMYRTKEFLQKEIAEIYNISVATVSLIVNKKMWKHI